MAGRQIGAIPRATIQRRRAGKSMGETSSMDVSRTAADVIERALAKAAQMFAHADNVVFAMPQPVANINRMVEGLRRSLT